MRRALPGLAAALWLVACSSSPPADDDTAGVPDDDSTGVDDDTAEPCEGIAWGPASAFTVGDPVGNWALHGYVDSDGDGVVEVTETSFTLQDVQCQGHESLAVVVGDTT